MNKTRSTCLETSLQNPKRESEGTAYEADLLCNVTSSQSTVYTWPRNRLPSSDVNRMELLCINYFGDFAMEWMRWRLQLNFSSVTLPKELKIKRIVRL